MLRAAVIISSNATQTQTQSLPACSKLTQSVIPPRQISLLIILLIILSSYVNVIYIIEASLSQTDDQLIM